MESKCWSKTFVQRAAVGEAGLGRQTREVLHGVHGCPQVTASSTGGQVRAGVDAAFWCHHFSTRDLTYIRCTHSLCVQGSGLGMSFGDHPLRKGCLSCLLPPVNHQGHVP